jgi:cyanamide hydratase
MAEGSNTIYGFEAVPRDPEKLLKDGTAESPYVPIDAMATPDTKLAQAVEEYVRKELSHETYNHSMRVYFYGYQVSKEN